MSHMVIYRGVDGKPGYHQTDDIHDAVGFVEKMRNDEGVEQARIFRLEEVVFEYRPYYRVELSPSSALAAGAEQASLEANSGAEQSVTNVLEPADESQQDMADSVVSESNGNGNGNGNIVSDAMEDADVESLAANKTGLFGR